MFAPSTGKLSRGSLSAPGGSLISIVLPIFNEAEVIPKLAARLTPVLDSLPYEFEIIAVDDGSADNSLSLLKGLRVKDSRWKIVSFSRNFGHQSALMAGLNHSRGNAVAILDADLQDPPELLLQLLDKWEEGYEVVYGTREKRSDSLLKRVFASAYYRVFQRVAEIQVPRDSGDFCVMDRKVVEVLCRLPERSVYLRGLRCWAGFHHTSVSFVRPARAGGYGKYSLSKMITLALDGFIGFSKLPLRISFVAGGLSIAAALIAFAATAAYVFRHGTSHAEYMIPGATGLILSAVLFLGGIQFLFLGIQGEYLGRVLDQVRERDRWIVRELVGFESARAQQLEPNASGSVKVLMNEMFI